MSARPSHSQPPTSSPDPAVNGGSAAEVQRLWTPWRMQFVGGGAAEPGCIFCNRLAASDDAESLILYRGDTAFVIMNLFPYNTGHVMIVPNAHVPTPIAAEPATLAGMTALLPLVLQALERVLHPAGFNIGMNVGDVAGAGVAGHLHEHVVPRWVGDANFMPILASTMVLPELISVTYAKVRLELQREMTGRSGMAFPPVAAVVLRPDGGHILLQREDEALALPRVPVDEASSPVWQLVARGVEALGVGAQLINWAGDGPAGPSAQPALLFLAREPSTPAPAGLVWHTTDAGLDEVQPAPDRGIIAAAITRVSSPVVAPPGVPPPTF